MVWKSEVKSSVVCLWRHLIMKEYFVIKYCTCGWWIQQNIRRKLKIYLKYNIKYIQCHDIYNRRGVGSFDFKLYMDASVWWKWITKLYLTWHQLKKERESDAHRTKIFHFTSKSTSLEAENVVTLYVTEIARSRNLWRNRFFIPLCCCWKCRRGEKMLIIRNCKVEGSHTFRKFKLKKNEIKKKSGKHFSANWLHEINMTSSRN